MIPSIADLSHFTYWTSLVGGIAAVLFAAWWVLDRGIDLVMARKVSRSNVVSFAERRKALNAACVTRP